MFAKNLIQTHKHSRPRGIGFETCRESIPGGASSASCLRRSQSRCLGALSARSAIFLLTFLFLTGCVVNQPVAPGDPYYAPVMAPSPIPAENTNGSLFRENVGLNLFNDRKATRVGDIITVMLQERTSSSKSSNIDITKDNEITSPAGSLLGQIPTYNGIPMGTELTSEREFKGEAEADQSNRLQGNISVTVVDVYPNGTLAIRGEKWITLNRGDEYIRISGLVRPDDVTPDNTVLSTKIAHAQITYSGEGDIANSQRMGWLSNFFNSPIWPF